MEKFIEFLNSFYCRAALWVCIFGTLIFVVYTMIDYVKTHVDARENIRKALKLMNENEAKREKAERIERQRYGATDKKNFMDKFNQRLWYAGIRQAYPTLTTELLLLSGIITLVITFIIATLAGGIIIGLIVPLILYAAISVVLISLEVRRNNKIEEHLLSTMNILENFSKSSTDLVHIIDRSSKLISEPLKTEFANTVIQARGSGDPDSALADLQDRVKTPYFKVMIKNLSIASKYQNNYSDIIADVRDSYHAYLKNKKRRKGLLSTGVAQIVMMIIVGAMCLFMVGDITEDGNIIKSLLNGGLMGQIILGAIVASLIGSLLILIAVIREGLE